MTNIKWVDVSKGIGILLVILSHNNFTPFLITTISTFNMPLFFFINGYLFHYAKYKQNKHIFVYNKFKRLVVPYFATNLLLLCIFTVLLYFKRNLFFYDFTSKGDNLIGILYGNGVTKSAIVFANTIDPNSWFLLSLFCASLLLYIIAYIHEKHGLLTSILLCILLILFGYGVSKYIFLPWSFDIACVSMIFMFSGYLINYYKLNLLHNESKKIYYIFISILLLFILILINGKIDMNTRQYSNLLLFSVGGLLGTYLTIELAKKICIDGNILIKLFVFLGQNSLIIFLFELVTPRTILSFINLFVDIKPLIRSSPVLNSLNEIIFTIVTVIIIKKIDFLHRIYYE